MNVKDITDETVINFTKTMEKSNLIAKGAHKNPKAISQMKDVFLHNREEVEKECSKGVLMIYDEFQDWLETYDGK